MIEQIAYAAGWATPVFVIIAILCGGIPKAEPEKIRRQR